MSGLSPVALNVSAALHLLSTHVPRTEGSKHGRKGGWKEHKNEEPGAQTLVLNTSPRAL